MYIFVIERRTHFACQELRFQPVHLAEQSLQLVRCQDFRAPQLLRMGTRAREVVRRKPEKARVRAR